MNRTAERQSLSAEVTEILSKVPIVKNPARKKFIGKFVVGLIKIGPPSGRNVQFCQVAQHLNDEAKVVCNEVRIQVAQTGISSENRAAGRLI